MKGCIWCGKKSEDLNKIRIKTENWGTEDFYACSYECEKEARDYIDYAAKNIKFFLLGLFGFMFTGIILMAAATGKKISPSIGMLVMLGGIGLTITIFPFTTPQTNNKVGLKKGKLIGRIAGLTCICLGIILCFVMNIKM